MAQFRNNFSRPYYRAGFYGWFRGLFREVVPSSPGQVTGSWVTASLVSGIGVGLVSGQFLTADVRTKYAVGGVEGDHETATVITKSKFLVKE